MNAGLIATSVSTEPLASILTEATGLSLCCCARLLSAAKDLFPAPPCPRSVLTSEVMILSLPFVYRNWTIHITFGFGNYTQQYLRPYALPHDFSFSVLLNLRYFFCVDSIRSCQGDIRLWSMKVTTSISRITYSVCYDSYNYDKSTCSRCICYCTTGVPVSRATPVVTVSLSISRVHLLRVSTADHASSTAHTVTAVCASQVGLSVICLFTRLSSYYLC